MSALDGSIVNIALPAIKHATGASMPTVSWVILIYLITLSSALLIFGRLSDIYGRRLIYITGVIVFSFGSLFCGLSGRIDALIVFRAFQAIGAAMMFALGPAVLVTAFPSSERGRALGIQATMTYLGLSLGPALGGFLTHRFGWPYIFFVNLPIGLIMASVARSVLVREKPAARQPFDPFGAIAMAVFLSSLMFAISKGSDFGWRNPIIWGSFCLSAIALVTLILVETRASHPALDLRMFSNRMFTASTMAAQLNYLSSATVNFLMPFYLLNACGYRADRAGLILMATPIAMTLFTAPSGFLSDKIGVRDPATIGTMLVAIGIFSLRTLGPGAPPSHIIVRLIFIGIGFGLFTSPNNSAIMGSAPKNRQGVAGAILAAARTTGFSSGVALAGAIFVTRLKAQPGVPQPIAVTNAFHTCVTVIACVSLIAVVLSALRGPHPSRRVDTGLSSIASAKEGG